MKGSSTTENKQEEVQLISSLSYQEEANKTVKHGVLIGMQEELWVSWIHERKDGRYSGLSDYMTAHREVRVKEEGLQCLDMLL